MLIGTGTWQALTDPRLERPAQSGGEKFWMTALWLSAAP
jgi:hypothetical protein